MDFMYLDMNLICNACFFMTKRFINSKYIYVPPEESRKILFYCPSFTSPNLKKNSLEAISVCVCARVCEREDGKKEQGTNYRATGSVPYRYDESPAVTRQVVSIHQNWSIMFELKWVSHDMKVDNQNGADYHVPLWIKLQSTTRCQIKFRTMISSNEILRSRNPTTQKTLWM